MILRIYKNKHHETYNQIQTHNNSRLSIEIEAETEQEAIKIFEKYDNPFEEMEKQQANMSPYYEDSYCEVIINNGIEDVDF